MSHIGARPGSRHSVSRRTLEQLQTPKSHQELEDATDLTGSELYDCLERLVDEGLVTVEGSAGRWSVFRLTAYGREYLNTFQASDPDNNARSVDSRTALRDEIEALGEEPDPLLNPPSFVRAYRGRLLMPMEKADGSGWICRINLCTGRFREVVDMVHGSDMQEAVRCAMSRVDHHLHQDMTLEGACI